MSNLTTDLERNSLEAHVDLCAIRYQNLENRLSDLETKVQNVHIDILEGQKGLSKVIITTTGTVIAGLLSTIVVIILKAS